MHFLNLSKLVAGDIIVTRSTTTLFKRIKSKAIGLATGGEFSHVALYVGNGSIIEAIPNGVHSHNLLRIPFLSASDVKVLRLKPEIFDQKAINHSIEFVRTNHGRQYAFIDTIFSTPLFKKTDASTRNKTFCSRLVASAYNNAGIPIVDNSNYASPEDINSSDYLFEVAGATVYLESAEQPEETSELLSKQVLVVNDLFKRFRVASGTDIQNFEQAISFVIEHPQKDTLFTKALNESGYFKLKDLAYTYAPWIKNPATFVLKQKFSSEEEVYSRLSMEVTNIESCIERYEQQFNTLFDLSNQHPQLNFIKNQKDFYQQMLQEYRMARLLLQGIPNSPLALVIAQLTF